MGTIESVGTHLARLLPKAHADTLLSLERGAQQQTFGTRDVLHARGIPLPPFVVLDGHVMDRRVAETGQVYGALIAGPHPQGDAACWRRRPAIAVPDGYQPIRSRPWRSSFRSADRTARKLRRVCKL